MAGAMAAPDCGGDFVLDGEDVRQIAVVSRQSPEPAQVIDNRRTLRRLPSLVPPLAPPALLPRFHTAKTLSCPRCVVAAAGFSPRDDGVWARSCRIREPHYARCKSLDGKKCLHFPKP